MKRRRMEDRELAATRVPALALVLFGVPLVVVGSGGSREARACPRGGQVRQVPLGTRGDRVVLLVLDQLRDIERRPKEMRKEMERRLRAFRAGTLRRARRPGWGMNLVWTIKASLREIDRDGKQAGAAMAIPGEVVVREISYTSEVAPLVRRGLALARRRPGFRPLGAPRLTFRKTPSSRCGEYRVIPAPDGTVRLAFRRRGAQASFAPLPRWNEYLAESTRRYGDEDVTGGETDLRPAIAYVIEHDLPDRQIVVLNLSTGYHDSSLELGWTPAQCRSVDTCLPPEPEGGHHLGWDFVFFRPLSTAQAPLSAPPRASANPPAAPRHSAPRPSVPRPSTSSNPDGATR